jgi:AraC family transcriptional regulator
VLAITKARSSKFAVYEYRCDAGPDDAPFEEVHGEYSVSYVQRGSFGYRSRGKLHELVAGSLLVGYPGDEYLCTHEHHCAGDVCLSFKLAPELVEEIASDRDAWRIGGLPPVPEIMVMGELAQAVADGRSDVGFDEVAHAFTSRFVKVVRGANARVRQTRLQERRRVVDVARWIEENSHENIDLDAAARTAGISSHHLLRTFARVLGVTPHQYLIRSRLRHAARLLTDDGSTITQIAGAVGFADLSNFIRTFGRAAGVSPQEFRKAARGRSGWCSEFRSEEPQKNAKKKLELPG